MPRTFYRSVSAPRRAVIRRAVAEGLSGVFAVMRGASVLHETVTAAAAGEAILATEADRLERWADEQQAA